MTPADALSRMREMCDRGEYCSLEVLTKLRNWGIAGTDADNILTRLIEDRYVDDARYARAIAHGKAAYSHWGKIKIKIYLLHKHISSNDIAAALDDIDMDEYVSGLRQVLAAKKRQLGADADTYEGRTKIYRYALAKGYEAALISSLLKAKDY